MVASTGVAGVVEQAVAALRAEVARQKADDVPVFPMR